MRGLTRQTDEVLDMLHEAGYKAYIVGGCVRDMLMGKEPEDYDITTSARPEEIKKVFSGKKTIDTGIAHGTVTVVIDGRAFEITTFRVEAGYSDGRRPDSVSFTGNLREDAARRDFTMNSIAFNREEGIIDYFGGAADIKAGVIRCVGDPKARFREDGLRIIRAVRFSSVIGFDIEEETLETPVPIFLLQPLVENAIIHGLEPKEGIGYISVVAYMADDEVELIVKDNGVGISPVKMKELLKAMEKEQIEPISTEGHSSIGIKNVNQRIKAYYGDAYGIRLESRQNSGTSVVIRIPKNITKRI